MNSRQSILLMISVLSLAGGAAMLRSPKDAANAPAPAKSILAPPIPVPTVRVNTNTYAPTPLKLVWSNSTPVVQIATVLISTNLGLTNWYQYRQVTSQPYHLTSIDLDTNIPTAFFRVGFLWFDKGTSTN